MIEYDYSALIEHFKKVEYFYLEFKSFTKENPVVGGMFGMWLLGVGTYFCKSIPKKISNFFYRYLTVSVTLNNMHTSFHDFLRWYEENKKITTNRTLRVTNGTHGWDDTQVSLGFGNHYFWHKKRPYKLNRTIQSADGGDKVKEEMTLTTIGFTQRSIIDLIKQTIPKKVKKKHIYIFKDSQWHQKETIPERSWESIILKKGQKDRIVNFIKDFENSRDWYKKMGINYKTGIVFSGPPGTGKSSTIKALAYKLQKNLCVLSCSLITESGLTMALSTTPKDSLVLMEDFDSLDGSGSRDDKIENMFSVPSVSISGILNAIDGVFSSNGRILIATTNHLDKIDEALLRPGRFDLKEVIDYADNDMALKMFNKFYPDFPIEEIKLNECVSLAQVENCFLKNKDNPEKALKEVELLRKEEYTKHGLKYTHIYSESSDGIAEEIEKCEGD